MKTGYPTQKRYRSSRFYANPFGNPLKGANVRSHHIM